MRRFPTSTLTAALVAVLLGPLSGLPAAAADSISGIPRVVDGDTLHMDGVRIRMHGIDAPESNQTCHDPDGREWRCGDGATQALRQQIGGGSVRCTVRDTDRYGRAVAVCFDAADRDLNAWMVENGWAIAYLRYSRDYETHQQRARAAALGIWNGTFLPPATHRRSERRAKAPNPADTTAAGNCIIKGNISRSGTRIYHVPGGRSYERTTIRTDQGERWFCTEAEARAAGWRRARN